MGTPTHGAFQGLPGEPSQQEVMLAQPGAVHPQEPLVNGVDPGHVLSPSSEQLGQESTTVSGAEILQAERGNYGTMDDAVSFADPPRASPGLQAAGNVLDREVASRQGQAGGQRATTNLDLGEADRNTMISGSGQIAQTGFVTPRSTRSTLGGNQQWLAGLEMRAWVSRLSSYLTVAAAQRHVSESFGRKSGLTSLAPGGAAFTIRGPLPRPVTSPTPPSSSSIPQEAIQAEVQRQLGDILQRLRTAEQRNVELEQALASARESQDGVHSTRPPTPQVTRESASLGVPGRVPGCEPYSRRSIRPWSTP